MRDAASARHPEEVRLQREQQECRRRHTERRHQGDRGSTSALRTGTARPTGAAARSSAPTGARGRGYSTGDPDVGRELDGAGRRHHPESRSGEDALDLGVRPSGPPRAPDRRSTRAW